MYLELAENQYSYMQENAVTVRDLYEYYIPVENDETGQIDWIREDYFDNLSDVEYQRLMSEASYRAMQLSEAGMADAQMLSFMGFGKKAKERRQQRRDRRKARKDAKAESKIARAKARADRAASGTRWIDKATETVGQIVGGITGGAAPERSTQDFSFEYETLPPGADVAKQKQWYENPVVIAGGLALLGLGVYAVARPKRRRR